MKRTAYDIIIRPIISEQSMEDMDIKKYVFEVAKDATKPEIAGAIEEIFDVRVIKVNTSHVRGRTKRVGANPQGTSRSWKKAVVKLSEDSKTIEIFENMA
ncbi:MAG: 50S ribosomal protein L23 [Oscillospiraceae bacterium]|nr:50S ribosomal protein L23 [Oscillospiraceae bacterium]